MERSRWICPSAFSVPAKPLASTAGIPLVGLNPQINSTGGTLMGGQTLYYALSAVDANGAEGGLSFSVMATIPAGTNTNQVTLGSFELFIQRQLVLCLSRRESRPSCCESRPTVAIAAQFIDAGAAATLTRAAGLQLRPRELLLASGAAAGRGHHYSLAEHRRQQHSQYAAE